MARQRPSPGLGRWDFFAGLLCLAFVVVAAPLLDELRYNFDEGVYVQQARLILEGQRPYRDFFVHQTPLYPMTLAAFVAPAPDSMLLHRLLSLLATAFAGFLVFRIASRLLPALGAWLALVLFLAAPLQYFDMLALPNALMLAFSTWGLHLVWFSQRRLGVSLGAVLLVGSILYKPLALSTGVALGLAMLVAAPQRSKLTTMVVAGALTGLCAWLLFHVTSDGVFSEMLRLQASRYAGRSGFEFVGGFAPFAQELARRGVDTAFEWNLSEHVRVFATASAMNLPLVLLAALGGTLLWTRPSRALKQHRLWLTLWWLVPLLFSLGVWEPSWDHYFVQYLPPLAILGALGLQTAWGLGRRVLPASLLGALSISLLALHLALGRSLPTYLRSLQVDYAELSPARTAQEKRLTFDPFLNFATGTIPACGIVDPLNVYAENSLIALMISHSDPARLQDPAMQAWAAHYVEVDDILDCLARDPEIIIGISHWGAWFMEDRLREYLDRLPPERFVDGGFASSAP